ncbi:ATP-grasp domain-containing protein [Apilactobacillus ozensis]|uniref:carbamoyl phosphate synthase preATP-grasp domain-containing protein n=1 Tax=Apilactobacillus ozensis TaxID=866801 RepID=UPI00200A25C6|nr:ATP-grasp domain-containing protein [Apilactobacillus ozensis]MCK8606517.1 ATP-grasp domain-containing protein [Apilactobacillus ozensis]
MLNKGIKRVLILGGGPSKIGQENELDNASFETALLLQKRHIKAFIVDNNPFSLTASAIQNKYVYTIEVNVKNVKQIIKNVRPDAIIATLGGLKAINVAQSLVTSGFLKEYNIQLLGMNDKALKMINNPYNIKRVIRTVNEPVVPSDIVSSEHEAFSIVREIGFPVIVKSIAAHENTHRQICQNSESLSDALVEGFNNSSVNKCAIEKSVVGYKQIEMVGVRDSEDTKILISGLEDIDPVGIHSGDSIVVAPIQTLTDPEYQALRNATFKIMEFLQVVGSCHVEFALDSSDGNYFITKINLNYNRNMALVERATGYPLQYVTTLLYLGVNLREVELPAEYHRLTAIIEPTIDHVVVKMPVWPFENVKNADEHLNTIMKSVGSTVGVGRSVEEAMLKALRSSQFSPKDILPSMREISNDELISQLIHPQINRFLVLIEAIRRGYQVEDLTELTKIDQFYFYKLKQLLITEEKIINHPLKLETIEAAHQNGFGDGMMSETWDVPIDYIKKLSMQAKSVPTYKMIEPSAGEFDENILSFYSSYEIENESSQFSSKTALVIGRGGNKLGPNTAADYYTAEILIQLREVGYKTIIINNNPNSLSLNPNLSDKRYIEPIQLGDILNIIRTEKPVRVFVPGNRHYLMKEIKKNQNLNVQILPPDQETGVMLPKKVTYALNFFVTQQSSYFITTEKLINNKSNGDINFITNYQIPFFINDDQLAKDIKISKNCISKSNWIGLVQILFNKEDGMYEYVGIRPLRLTETIFMSHATGINWIRELVKFYTNKLDEVELKNNINKLKVSKVFNMQANFPFKQLRINKKYGDSSQEVGARISFNEIK